MSIGYPMLSAAIALICNKWFPDNERTLVTAICGLAIPSGNIFAFTMSGLIFSGINVDPHNGKPLSSKQSIKDAEMRLITIQNIWFTSITIPLILLIRAKPDNPPSLIAM